MNKKRLIILLGLVLIIFITVIIIVGLHKTKINFPQDEYFNDLTDVSFREIKCSYGDVISFFDYDANGDIIKQIDYNKDLSLKKITQYEYVRVDDAVNIYRTLIDLNNDIKNEHILIGCIKSNDTGETIYELKNNFNYDEQLKDNIFKEKNNIILRFVDSKNNLKADIYYLDNKIDHIIYYNYEDSYSLYTYNYDEDDSLISILENYYKESELQWVEKAYEYQYTFDSKGNAIKKTELAYYSDGNKAISVNSYKYDSKGRLIEEAFTSSKDTVDEIIRYKYNNKGQLINKNVQNMKRNIPNEYIYLYY